MTLRVEQVDLLNDNDLNHTPSLNNKNQKIII